jgi:hypothetical protein
VASVPVRQGIGDEEEEPTMNKRSAMLVAAGLVLTLIVGGVAIAVGITGPSSSAAATKTSKHHKHQKPIIKTVRRTVTVHKQAPAAGVAAPVYASAPASSSSNGSGYSSAYPSSGSSYGDDSYEGGSGHGGEDNHGGGSGHGGGDD